MTTQRMNVFELAKAERENPLIEPSIKEWELKLLREIFGNPIKEGASYCLPAEIMQKEYKAGISILGRFLTGSLGDCWCP